MSEQSGIEYARDNILQSLENAITYASYIPDNDLRYEIEEMAERLKRRVERKLRDYGAGK